MKLSDLHTGETGVIVKVNGHGSFRKRIVEMGFVKGKHVKVILNAPLHDPIEYEIMGYKISLRRDEAALVEVISEREASLGTDLLPDTASLKGLSPRSDDRDEMRRRLDERMKRMAETKRRVINVALVGNPNCGKTSLFNFASGGHEHVGNYSGVTVDAKEGTFSLTVQPPCPEGADRTADPCAACGLHSACTAHADGSLEYRFRLVDLPGTYSLSAYSPEELYVRRHLIDDTPDVIVNVVDASNLERNLYLTTQLIDMNLRMVVALNMYDELEDNHDRLDYRQLSHLLGVPMVPTVSRTGQGIRELFETVIAVFENQSDEAFARHIHVNHGEEIERSIDRLKGIFQRDDTLRSRYSTRYLAIKYLEGDSEAKRLVETLPEHDELVAARYEEAERLKEIYHEAPDNAITDAKYGFIQGALRETFTPHEAIKGRTLTERIDALATNKWLGFPIFFAILFVIFYATFTLGQYPMDWIDWLVEKLKEFVVFSMPPGLLRDMIVDGAISGVGAVIVFLPNILILYLFISLLEDSGYMARAAFITDKLMHHMGLHGKSFIPLVMGFGCNVPAIMATRTIENPRSRLVTMLVTPFMSCSARIPIYVVLISAFFPQHGAWLMLGLYLIGIAIAILMAKLLSKTIVGGKDLPFVMELPPYRLPTGRSVLRHTWEKGRQYLRKMGGIILVFSVIIWGLNYFPAGPSAHETAEKAPAATAQSAAQSDATGHENAADEGTIRPADNPSYLERLGHTIAPVFAPVGFDWKMSVGILSGVGAKELVVSTLAVMYAGEDVDADDASTDTHLSQSLRSHMTSEQALSYLLFILLYFPCIATVTAIKNESGRWRWALFAAGYTTLVAYVVSLAYYQIALALGA